MFLKIYDISKDLFNNNKQIFILSAISLAGTSYFIWSHFFKIPNLYKKINLLEESNLKKEEALEGVNDLISWCPIFNLSLYSLYSNNSNFGEFVTFSLDFLNENMLRLNNEIDILETKTNNLGNMVFANNEISSKFNSFNHNIFKKETEFFFSKFRYLLEDSTICKNIYNNHYKSHFLFDIKPSLIKVWEDSGYKHPLSYTNYYLDNDFSYPKIVYKNKI